MTAKTTSDSGLACLQIAAKFHHQEIDAGKLRHKFSVDGAHLDIVGIVRAAREAGLKAVSRRIDWQRLQMTPMPVICAMSSGGFALLLSASAVPGDETEALVLFPDNKRPQKFKLPELQKMFTGECVMLASRAAKARDTARFDFTWFVPAIVKYRKQLSEVVVMSLFLQLFALVIPVFFQVVMDKVLVHRGLTTLDVLILGMTFVVVFDTALGGLRTYLFTHTTNRMDVELGARLYRHLLSLPQAYFESRRVGDSVARVRELDSIRDFLTGSVVTVLLDFLFIFVFIGVMVIYSGTLTLVVLASLPCYIVLSLIISPMLRKRLDEKFVRGAENQAFLVESVSGAATVKAHAAEPQMIHRWNNQLAAFVSASFRAANVANAGSHIVQLISKLTTAAILWFGARAVINGEMTVGQLVAFNMLAGRVSAPVIRLAQMWQDFQQVGVSMRRLADILDSPSEHDGGRMPALPALKGAVQYADVSFHYPGTEKPAVKNINLDIKPGQSIGIVGRSGSGKSTLTKLAQRLYLPTDGRITMDGIDLALADPAWLRRQIGVVLQENLLFNRTVRENIALANPSLTMDDIIGVAKLAGAHDFISELGEGYETIVAEHGVTLSGGQRQRVAIARALATNPRVLILDEATSALDYESEKVIQDNMRQIAEGRTVIIISHRLSAVRDCNSIIVMEKGEIKERGAHAELLEIGGIYARLHSLQQM